MAENKLADLSMEFSINTLKMLDNVKGHYALKNQLEKKFDFYRSKYQRS